MKKPIIYFIAILLLMVAFSLLIYPTPYRYLEYDYNDAGGKAPVRLNVFTGKTQIFSPQYGWTKITNHE